MSLNYKTKSYNTFQINDSILWQKSSFSSVRKMKFQNISTRLGALAYQFFQTLSFPFGGFLKRIGYSIPNFHSSHTIYSLHIIGSFFLLHGLSSPVSVEEVFATPSKPKRKKYMREPKYNFRKGNTHAVNHTHIGKEPVNVVRPSSYFYKDCVSNRRETHSM